MEQSPIEDHALLSDNRTAALVTREGTVDWLCLPRFDSPAVFCALLGDESNGHWSLRIAGGRVVSRRYLPGTLVLETTWEAPHGRAVVLDFMPSVPAATGSTADRIGHEPSAQNSAIPDNTDLMRTVKCTHGRVIVEQELRVRFDYGAVVPWVRQQDDAAGQRVFTATAGPNALALHGPSLYPEGRVHRGRWELRATSGAAHPTDVSPQDDPQTTPTDTAESGTSDASDQATWTLTWFPSWHPVPAPPEAEAALAQTARGWAGWVGQTRAHDEFVGHVERSLLTLKALTHKSTGGIVAAPTTSLPEDFGGERNWDYRYCWLRDAALTLEALLHHGHTSAAVGWRDWLLRAIAGDPERLQIMYGVAGERFLLEMELDHLRGYADSQPVRVGNAAVGQYQGDVVGEVMIALALMRAAGLAETKWSWDLQVKLLRYCSAHIDDKDQGLWEMRGEAAYFTQSRIMVWAAFDAGIAAVEREGLSADPADVANWRELRDRLRVEVMEHGVGADGAFTQVYGGRDVDASLLTIPHSGFVRADDPHMLATVARIESDLITEDGLVLRYRPQGQDGVAGGEHAFVVCSFWLVAQYASSGRVTDARELMDRALACGNDLGLFSEEFDGRAGRMAGNFPQAFSHLGLIRAVDALETAAVGAGAAEVRLRRA